MPTPNEIVSQMRRTLSVSEPDLDTSIGTPIRKILDVVGEAIAEAYIDRYLLEYQYDIDSRSGPDLDAFVALFGFSRQSARRSTGVVVLQRNSPATQSVLIPVGTQFITSNSPAVVVQSISGNIFPEGATSISVTVQASVAGSSGNLSANSVSRMTSNIAGISSVSNPAALTGGSDSETDEQLRERFKRSVFRNLAGTEDMYLGIALDDEDSLAANVVGPVETWEEQIEIVNGVATSTIAPVLERYLVLGLTGTPTSEFVILSSEDHLIKTGDVVRVYGVESDNPSDVLPNGTWIVGNFPYQSQGVLSLISIDGETSYDRGGALGTLGTLTFDNAYLERLDRCKYIYPRSYFFGANLSQGDFLTPGVHYEFDYTSIPPTITSLDSSNCPDGIYDLSFQFLPVSSRNAPLIGTTNAVDIYVSGQRPTTVSETAIVDGRIITTDRTGSFSHLDFIRTDGSHSVEGNLIVRLSFQPIVDIPDTIDIHTYSLDIENDYWMVQDDTEMRGSWSSFGGLEIDVTSLPITAEISSSTNASPIVVTTSSAHGFSVGTQVIIQGHDNEYANGVWTISAVTSTTLTLEGSNGSLGSSGTATGNVYIYHPLVISYTYDEIPLSVQSEIESWRLITTDVVCHSGTSVSLKINLAVILLPGYSVSGVQSAVDRAVSAYLNDMGFGDTVQISDLTQVVASVDGIDAVRVLSSRDISSSSIVGIDGDTSATLDTGVINIATSTPHGLSAGEVIFVSGAAFTHSSVSGTLYPMEGAWVVNSVVSTTEVQVIGNLGSYTYSSGGTAYLDDFGVQRMNDDGSHSSIVYVTEDAPHRATDISTNEREFVSLHSVSMTVKAANTWGSV